MVDYTKIKKGGAQKPPTDATAQQPPKEPAKAFGTEQNMAVPDRPAVADNGAQGANVVSIFQTAGAKKDEPAKASEPATAAPQQDVSELVKELAALRAEVAQLRTDVANAKASSPAQGAGVGELSRKVEELTTELNEAKGNIDFVSGEMAGLIPLKPLAAYADIVPASTDRSIAIECLAGRDFTAAVADFGPEKMWAALTELTGVTDRPDLTPKQIADLAKRATDGRSELALAFQDAAILWAAAKTDPEEFSAALNVVLEIIDGKDTNAAAAIAMARLSELSASPDATKAALAKNALELING